MRIYSPSLLGTVGIGEVSDFDPTVGQLFLTAAGGWPTVVSGCAITTVSGMATNLQSLYTLDFDTTVKELAEWTVAMPSDWDGGTVTATFYWAHGTAATNFGVCWGLRGRSYANDEALDQAMGTAQESVDTGGTANDLYVTSGTVAITLGGTPAASELVQLRVYRDPLNANDNLAVDAKLIGVMINYVRT